MSSDPTERLGNLVVCFQQLEGDLVELFGVLMRGAPRNAVRIIATELSFRRILSIVESLLLESSLDSTIKDRAASLLPRLRAVEGQRNQYVHSRYEWLEIGSGPVVYERIKGRNKAGVGYKEHFETLRHSDPIDSIAGQCMRLSQELSQITEDVFLATASPAEVRQYTEG